MRFTEAFEDAKERVGLGLAILVTIISIALVFGLYSGVIWLVIRCLNGIGITHIGNWSLVWSWKLSFVVLFLHMLLKSIFKPRKENE